LFGTRSFGILLGPRGDDHECHQQLDHGESPGRLTPNAALLKGFPTDNAIPRRHIMVPVPTAAVGLTNG
jgi:hypothetical protein